MNQQADSGVETLVIDDDPGIREIIRGNLLEKFPAMRFREAENGNAALILINERVPDLILADLRMPGLNGFALIRLLRNRDRTRHIPIIAISGLSDSGSVRKAVEAGANDYCLKPINFAQLAKKIETALARWSKRTDLTTRQRSVPRRTLLAAASALMPIRYPEREGLWIDSPLDIGEGEPLLFNGHQFFRSLRVPVDNPYLWGRVERCHPEEGLFRMKVLFEDVPGEYEEQLRILNRSRDRFRRDFAPGPEGLHLELPCEIRDLSGEGLKVVGSLPWKIGSTVHLSLKEIIHNLSFQSSESRLRAVIRWSEQQGPHHVAGVQFADVDEDLRRQIMGWCLETRLSGAT